MNKLKKKSKGWPNFKLKKKKSFIRNKLKFFDLFFYKNCLLTFKNKNVLFKKEKFSFF
jgi:hypothetical protein